MKQIIYNKLPSLVKNILITIYNLRFQKIYNYSYKRKLKEAEDFFYNYSKDELNELQNKIRYRLGDKIKLTYKFVNRISHEKNGKYMMIKNNIQAGEIDDIQ